MTLSQLRTKHPALRYQAYEYHFTPAGLSVSFSFLLEPDITFKPTITFSGPQTINLAQFSPLVLDNLVFHLGLIELFSYWKTACPPKIIIEPGSLDEAQCRWWHTLLLKGMGEFFFVNQIDFTGEDFVTLVAENNLTAKYPDKFAQSLPPLPATPSQASQSILIPLGGGKDSAVTLELLRRAYVSDQQTKLGTLLLNPTGASQEIADASGLEQIQIHRTLDPKMLELNQAGYLNGHTPFSALVAFMTVLSSYLYNYEYVPVSNERSSNEGNVRYLDHDINHQYSKTFTFEHDFQEYVSHYLLPPALKTGFYFSFLRPIYELQIAKIFAGFEEYHRLFRSCNRGQKTNSWCGDCPKCLFAYSILYPFLGHDRLVAIFGQDLFQKESLLTYAKELTGYGETKPFECVGTHEESLSALYMCLETARQESPDLPPLLALISENILKHETQMDTRSQNILNSWNNEHALPQTFEEILKSAVTQPPDAG